MGFYFSHRNRCDIAFSTLVAIIFYILSRRAHLGFVWLDGDDRRALLLSVFGVAASFSGFVLAASTFLIGHVQNSRFDILRKSKGWRQFPGLVKGSIWWSLVLTMASVVCSLMNDKLFIKFAPVYVFCSCQAIISLIALVWVVLAVLSIGSD